jgi:hypothetical protein
MYGLHEFSVLLSFDLRGFSLSMKRASVIVLAALLALMAIGPVSPASAAVRQRLAPKVAIVVGPTGSATDYYRKLGNEAASAALKFTPNVVRIYSPDATWSAVKQALTGASIVVYLGHGNGWPSRYRNELTPSTQNGMGLNPHAGAGDTHQYFGEGPIAKEIKLAKDAVVILSHLCYASGNSEPGLPEGTLETSQQRVDNYAAGFIKAGAAAVIAEGHMGPAYYVRSILAGKSTIDRIWRDSPMYHGHLLRFDSLRSPGYTAQMDPDRVSSGFYRSIVFRDGLAAANTLAGATRSPLGRSLPPLEPTLAGLGMEFDAPDLASPPSAGSTTNFTFKIGAGDPSVLPAGIMVAVRWDPLSDPAATVPAAPATPTPAAPASPPASAPAATAPDPVDLVSPEVPGEVVAPVAATRTGGGISVPVTVPAKPGLYRLVGTIHGTDGVAYDAATQALMPALIVRVTGSLGARYDAPVAALATAGEPFKLHVTVTNFGADEWGVRAIRSDINGAVKTPARRATLIARWVSLSGVADPSQAEEGSSVLPAGLAAGASMAVDFVLTTPKTAGDYLLLLDVITPDDGSLAGAGVPPGIVRVTVSESVATPPQ